MKKLTQGEVGQVVLEAIKNKHYYPELRLGQEIFNVTYSHYPELANSLRATGADCFYNDNKIQHFIEAISQS